MLPCAMNKQMIIDTLAGGQRQFLGTLGAVPEDKLDWKPLDLGRSALELARDAAGTPAVTVQVLQLSPDQPAPTMDELTARAEQPGEDWDRAQIIEHIETTHAALVRAIESLSDEELARPLSIPMNPHFSLSMPLARWALLPYRSYISRFGQINYIQTLYGDDEGH